MTGSGHPHEAVIIRTSVLISGMCLAGGSEHDIVLHTPDSKYLWRGRKEG